MENQVLFKELKLDHETQRTLLEMLINTSAMDEDREITLKKLDEEFKRHLNYEQKYLYTPLVRNESTKILAKKYESDHSELEYAIDELSKMDTAKPSFIKQAKKLKVTLEKHIDQEEKELFPLAEHAFEKPNEFSKDYHKASALESIDSSVLKL